MPGDYFLIKFSQNKNLARNEIQTYLKYLMNNFIQSPYFCFCCKLTGFSMNSS